MLARQLRPRALAAATVLALAAGLLGMVPAHGAPIGTISGTVRNTEGTGLPDQHISLQRYDEGSGWNHANATFTTETGGYAFTDLEPATYRLYFDGSMDYLGEYWDDTTVPDDAAEIVVTEEDPTHDADAQLTAAARITGTVTGTDDLALDGVDITAHLYDEESDEWHEVASTETNHLGNYQLPRLSSGTYRVGFDEDLAGTYIDEFWDDAETIELATDIDVELGETESDIDARLTEGGHITGTVTDVADEPLGGAMVTAYRYDLYNGEWDEFGNAFTESDGTYDLSGLGTDDYRVEFSHWGGYFSEFYDNAVRLSEAEDVPVTKGTTTGDIDARLTYGGSIAGTVTGDGGPVAGVEIDAYRYNSEDDHWQIVNGDVTDEDGTYEVEELTDGVYRIEFAAEGTGFASEFWDDARRVEAADDITVVEGEVTGEIDADLSEQGLITGSVSGEGGVPLEGVRVMAVRYLPGEDGWENVADATTDSAGDYVLGGLPAGNVRLQFRDASDAGYLDEFWQDATDIQDADDVTVVAGETTAVGDARLDLGGSIAGTVVGDGGTALSGIYVRLYTYDEDADQWISNTGQYADGDGSYGFGRLRSGDYRLEFWDFGGGGYTPEFWQDSATLAEADDIAVTAGASVELPDAELDQGGRITGTVTDPGGAHLSYANVTAWRWHPVGEYWESYTSTSSSSADGTYALVGLPAGRYRVEFDGPGGYATEWWDDAPTRAEAEDIEVATGETVDDIDPVLASGATISGTVTGTGGEPLSDYNVQVWKQDPADGSWEPSGSEWTDGDGSYALAGLAAGTYRVRFGYEWGEAYLGEYWNDAATLEEADDIVVPPGSTTDDIDAELAPSGVIRGKVTGPGGRGLGDIDVTAYHWFEYDDGEGDWERLGDVRTESDGRYELAGLPTGNVRLRFLDDYERGIATEYWEDAATLEGADDIPVVAGETTPGINAQLGRAGHIAGTVTDEAGNPLDEVEVIVRQLAGGRWAEVETDSTSSAGRYDVGNLYPGTYRVEFEHWGGRFVTEYWNDSATIADADDVVVTAGRTTGGTNAQLAPAGQIRGRVTGPDGAGLDDVGITAFTKVGGVWQEAAEVDTYFEGRYEIGGLAAGTYRLEFADQDDRGLLTEYWDDSPTLADADDIVVVGGETVSDRDTQLAEPVTIANTSLPAISGTARVGSPLTASPGSWTPGSGLDFGYQWKVGGTAVGATGTTYVPTTGDVGKEVTVIVTASADRHVSATATSAPTAAVTAIDTPAVANTAPPSIAGKAAVGSKLTATPGAWTPADAATAYQWLVGGAPVAGATTATYTPTKKDVGKSLQVRVTATKAGHVAGTALSAATTVAPGTLAAKTKPKVTGKPKKNAVLKASPGSWSPAAVTVEYQWFVGTKAIKKATKATLKLAGATLKTVRKKVISVRVTVSAPGYTTVVTKLKVRGTVR